MSQQRRHSYHISLIRLQYQILQSAGYKNITQTLFFDERLQFLQHEASVNAAALNPQQGDL